MCFPHRPYALLPGFRFSSHYSVLYAKTQIQHRHCSASLRSWLDDIKTSSGRLSVKTACIEAAGQEHGGELPPVTLACDVDLRCRTKQAPLRRENGMHVSPTIQPTFARMLRLSAALWLESAHTYIFLLSPPRPRWNAQLLK